MEFEFAYRTYNSFGPNATLHLAGLWLHQQLPAAYGGEIATVLVEACCRNLSPAKRTLESMHSNFEAWRRSLPAAEVVDEGATLRLCYAAVYPTREEVQRDGNVLSLKSFRQAITKAAELIRRAPSVCNRSLGLDVEALASDVERQLQNAPSSLADLARLYLNRPLPLSNR